MQSIMLQFTKEIMSLDGIATVNLTCKNASLCKLTERKMSESFTSFTKKHCFQFMS